jgi:hypothetical protein
VVINTGEEAHCRNLTLTHRDARSPHRSPDETASCRSLPRQDHSRVEDMRCNRDVIRFP